MLDRAPDATTRAIDLFAMWSNPEDANMRNPDPSTRLLTVAIVALAVPGLLAIYAVAVRLYFAFNYRTFRLDDAMIALAIVSVHPLSHYHEPAAMGVGGLVLTSFVGRVHCFCDHGCERLLSQSA